MLCTFQIVFTKRHAANPVASLSAVMCNVNNARSELTIFTTVMVLINLFS